MKHNKMASILRLDCRKFIRFDISLKEASLFASYGLQNMHNMQRMCEMFGRRRTQQTALDQGSRSDSDRPRYRPY